jgi:SAM-dependent methyltransferase
MEYRQLAGVVICLKAGTCKSVRVLNIPVELSMTNSKDPGRPLSHLGISEEVRDFYERYPYPRPVDDLGSYGRTWNDLQKRRADFHLFWPDRLYREDFSILVAGCGTSQAAKYAMRWPHAQVVGIDFSATSLHRTEDLKRKHDLKNLHVHQLAVERAGELGRSFDQIVCTGVLHHLEDPDAGLSALRNVLNADGAIHLMVYAPYGRTGIYMLQEFCRRLGISATDGAIRELITALGMLPPGHPLETILRVAPDFGDEAELADALLHPQDRSYSVPQFFDFLRRAGLTFGRWTRQAPYSARCGVIANLPQAERMAQLSPEEIYAAVELFRGTMVRHSAVVYRDEGSTDLQRIDFSRIGWLDYVPIRIVDTVCVLERLPQGAAAVLINRAHTFRDLFLPITAMQKRLFDAIDGELSIGEIVRATLSSAEQARNVDLARDFFDRLWWQDQVVFDTSGR